MALTELAFTAIVTTDVIMMGRLGSTSLAAGTLAAQYFWVFEFLERGILSALAPIIAQHLGTRRFRRVRGTVRQGFWVAVLVAIPCGLMVWNTNAIFVLLGQDPVVAEMSQAYLRFMLIALIPSLWHGVLGDFLAAHERPRAVLVICIIGIAINALANYAFMFGHFGAPAIGLAGAGVASAIVMIFMFLATLGFVLTDRRLKRYHLLGHFWRLDWPQLRNIITVGTPIAMMDTGKLGSILVGYFLMGLVGIDAPAAFGVTVQCVEVLLIAPIGLMQAASVRVGLAAGAENPQATSRAGLVSISLGFGFALLSAVVLVFFGELLVGIYFDTAVAENDAAITMAVSLLVFGALFLIIDSVHTITQGALMGLTDTQVPMLLSLGSYAVSLPAAAYFGVYLGYSGQAIWLSLAFPLGVLALLFIQRFRFKSRDLAWLEGTLE
ncbi:MAG: MATE family efflux transporter [Alphaproteobacteria bacterium]|jgi:multidrug resistance protein, MATE family|nr:MATE family efflux transporter [Rhodospirillaceae bacterium]MBT6204231.1 MATE family efflux transporter [Rhodospirillaceae bacterium]MBT7613901.1 MATE family efflux transporter [Rhodospirillaceae bacterium]MBT7647345.1 MATE family efflux transporter [Rhodospirillaceae bacterium]MDG2479882.1 MATE family efflux transporter [Alphaproteobacteria bacterium]